MAQRAMRRMMSSPIRETRTSLSAHRVARRERMQPGPCWRRREQLAPRGRKVRKGYKVPREPQEQLDQSARPVHKVQQDPRVHKV